jgi:parallel beta-helix repeat protein
MITNTRKFRLALTVLTLVALLFLVFAAVGWAAGTHSATEPTWSYRGVVTHDTGVKMKHVTVVHDPLGLEGVTGNPKFMMWWSTSSPDQLFAATSNDGLNWSGTGTARTKLSVTFPSTTVPIYHPEVIYDRLGFEEKKSAGVVHFKMWFYDGGTEDYNWIRYAESSDGINWTVFEDSPCATAPGCTNPSNKNYLEFSGGSGNEMSVLYKRDGTGIVVNGVDQKYVGYQATNNPVAISTDGAWFYRVDGQGGGPTDVCREMIIAGDDDVVNYRAWDDLPGDGDLTSWDSATGLSWNSPEAGNAPIVGASWPDFYGAMSVVVVGDRYYMYDTMNSDNYSVGLLIAPPVPPTEVWVDDDWTSQTDVDAFDPNLIWQYDAFNSIQDGIDAVAGSTVLVHAGTYNERVTINKSVDLRGAQYGVNPTAAGARTIPADESIVDVTGLGYANPDIAVEIASGVSGVTIDGFTLIGDPTNTLADTSVIRCGGSAGTANNVSISNNIVDGKYGVIYKGGVGLTVHQNRMVVNKNGVVVQPNAASNVTISDNVFNLGSSPAGDESAIYLSRCDQCNVIGNTATGFINAKGLVGSGVSNLTVSGNTFTGNKDAVSIWGSSTYIAISDNDLSNSLRYGINIKGQDVDITGNEIKNNGDVGINIDRHVINTERVTVLCNNISGNTNYGVKVNTANVTEIINAEYNWWGDASGPFHPTSNSGGSGNAISDGVDFDPWLSAPVGDTCPPPADDAGPITSNVLADPNPVAVNGEVTLTANVDDTNTGGSNIASAEYSLDDGASWEPMDAQVGDFDAVSEDVIATFSAPADAGIYDLCVRGTDVYDNIGPAECILLVVYDPEGGFVTGGGWIWSPKTAYTDDPELEGKATFGFVAKYKKGAQTPEGQTEFVFKVADLNFHSDSYEWLVVAGAKAQFKGTGTINGEGEYKFMLMAIDADINEKDSFEVDRFRIKIWSEDESGNETVVYDNALGDDSDGATTYESLSPLALLIACAARPRFRMVLKKDSLP